MLDQDQGCLQVVIKHANSNENQDTMPIVELTLSKDPFHKSLHFTNFEMIYNDQEVIYNNSLQDFKTEQSQLFISYGPRGSAKHQAIFGSNGILLQLARSLKLKEMNANAGAAGCFIRADWITNQNVITCFKKTKKKEASSSEGWHPVKDFESNFAQKIQQILDKDELEIEESQNMNGILQLKNFHLIVSLRLSTGIHFHFLRLASQIILPLSKTHDSVDTYTGSS